MDTYLAALIAHLDTLTMGATPTDKLQYIDMDWGQLDYYNNAPPVKFPCALIDIRTMNYTGEGIGTQIGIVDIEVRIADIPLANSSAAAPATQRHNAMRIHRLVNAVFAHLHGWQPANSPPSVGLGGFGPLTRISGTKTKRQDGIKEMRLVFRLQTDEQAARRPYNTVSLQITP